MESREFWAPEQSEIEVVLDMLEFYFAKDAQTLKNEQRLRLLLLSMAYLRSGTALRIARFLDESHPEFAQKMVDTIREDLAMSEGNALRIGAHVMASRIKHLAAVKVLSKVFAKERLEVVKGAIEALNNYEDE